MLAEQLVEKNWPLRLPDRMAEKLPIQKACFTQDMRLREALQFQQLFQTGKRIKQGVWVLIWQSNTLCKSRLGLALARKWFLHQPDRHFWARTIREFFRLHQHLWCPIDLVISVRSSLKTSELRAQAVCDLEALWRRTGELFQASC